MERETTLAEAIQRALFFGHNVHFTKDDITGVGVMLIVDNDKQMKEQVLLPVDHIKDHKFVKYIGLLSNALWQRQNPKAKS